MQLFRFSILMPTLLLLLTAFISPLPELQGAAHGEGIAVTNSGRVKGKIVVPGDNEDVLFGDTKIFLKKPTQLYVSGDVSFQPTNQDAEWVALNLRAIHEDGKTVVFSTSRKHSVYQGSKPGIYFSLSRAEILTLPIGGNWTIQLAAHAKRGGPTLKVHTWHLNAFTVGK